MTCSKSCGTFRPFVEFHPEKVPGANEVKVDFCGRCLDAARGLGVVAVVVKLLAPAIFALEIRPNVAVALP
jgi:hypothetical protein